MYNYQKCHFSYLFSSLHFLYSQNKSSNLLFSKWTICLPLQTIFEWDWRFRRRKSLFIGTSSFRAKLQSLKPKHTTVKGKLHCICEDVREFVIRSVVWRDRKYGRTADKSQMALILRLVFGFYERLNVLKTLIAKKCRDILKFFARYLKETSVPDKVCSKLRNRWNLGEIKSSDSLSPFKSNHVLTHLRTKQLHSFRFWREQKEIACAYNWLWFFLQFFLNNYSVMHFRRHHNLCKALIKSCDNNNRN